MKLKRLLFLIVLALFLIGCGGSKPENPDDIPDETPDEQPQQPSEVVFETTDEYIELDLFEKYTLHLTIENVNNYEIQYEADTEGVIEVNEGVIEAIDIGYTILYIKLLYGEEVQTIFVEVEVIEVSPTKIITNETIELVTGSTYQIEYELEPSNATKLVEFTCPNSTIAKVDESGMVTCVGLGTAYVTIKSQLNPSVRKRITIEVVKPYIEEIKCVEEIVLGYNQEYQLEWEVLPKEAEQEVIFEASNSQVAMVDENGKITTNRYGESEIVIKSKMYPDKNCVVKVKVEGTKASSLTGEDTISLTLGQTKKIEYSITPSDAYQGVDFLITEEDGIKVSGDGYITGIKNGIYTIILKTIDETNIQKEITVEVTGESTPIYVIESGVENLEIAWGKTFNPLEGVYAYDGEDGEITSLIEIKNPVDTQTCGAYTVTYTVKDKDNNTSTLEREIKVIWNYAVQFIGHAGSYYGIMNTEEAILYAATVLKYQAIEIDLKQTKDGVFVLCHDDDWKGKGPNDTTDVVYQIASTNWDDLKDVVRTESRKAGIPAQNGSVTKSTYSSKICTLERYLEICKQYGIKAVIELKYSKGISSSDQSRMQALMDEVEKAGMLDNIILLGSTYQALIWTRENGYENVQCQYLVNSCESETVLQRCIDYNFEVSINVTGQYLNRPEWLAKYKEQGIKISSYTFTQYSDYDVVQKWINHGVDYVTVDWHMMSQLQLPEK